ncbi:MAG: two component regulator three y domain-containing protein [Cytophagales bacterium CG12_big_fil_rev_8_21_14_0_65_40_12]|nr:MAG: two component regulator three y domain-containing protein [Cytophagales bacterium CG12_big_fil_rev_8_21_14_0_65_40_12]PIW06043.1 MAG: two component regulator three y domain-containing protein [Cytophagales bacterium CG17_big_fil_post_rev_8_21_14_2_50_40_13]
MSSVYIKRQLLFSIFFLACAYLNSYAQMVSIKGLPFVKNYTPDVYEAGIQNWSMTQDEDGILYIANNLGLLQFDGSKWTILHIKNNTKVRSVYVASDRKIYAGSQADFGYFYPDAHGLMQFNSLADSLPSEVRDFDETWKIFAQNGLIYFCTFKNIYVYDGVKLSTITSKYALEISFQVNNQLYVQEWNNGLSLLKNGELQLIRNGEFFKTKRISDIISFDRDQLLISTFNDGNFLYSQGEIKAFSLKNKAIEDEIINDALRLSNGEIALATQNGGLYLIDKEGRINLHLDKDKGLIDNTINSMHEDHQGNLWLALNNGIARVELNSPFSIIDERLGLPGAGYTALAADNKVFLGTNNGLYSWKDGALKFVAGSSGKVYSIQKINETLLMGHHSGAFKIENDRAINVSDEKGAWVFKQHPFDKNKIIEGTYLGINSLTLKDGEVATVNKIQGFDESSRVMEFSDSILWVAQGYKGVFKVKLSSDLQTVKDKKLYNSNKGFPSDVLINVYNIANELIFSSESGFYKYDKAQDSFFPYAKYSDILGYESSIVDMEEDELGNIYFIERSKVGVLKSTNTGGFELSTAAFNKVKGLWNDDLGNITVLDNDNILIGAREGFIHYDPTFLVKKTDDFSVLIRQVLNKGKSDSIVFHGQFMEGKEIVKTQPEKAISSFKFRQNSFVFDYTAIHFESEGEIHYQYKLEPYENEWSDWTASSTKEYTNLHEGDYTFRLRAKNIYNEEMDAIPYSFHIKPPIYRSTFAYLLYGFGSVSLLFLGFKSIDKHYKKAALVLTEKQDLEIKEKEDEIESITQKTEQEIIQLKNDKLQSEIHFKSQELTSSTMHLIQKNELLNQIKNTLKNFAQNESPKNLSAELNKIVKTIDKDLAKADEWQKFVINFDQVHGNFITRLKESYPKLTPQELKFSAYIRMNLNTKEIANLLNISVRGVEIGRYRIRKKLNLERQDNLSDFILRF